ncbi:hypothetical protein BJF83_12440 [Nocardiopsis sp. CNR-923]|uniref:hypothetical protein n=1 Tax=Nocardiopsis sp. CNR-923 TaxID=1904965 RepID=UPI000963A31D|nr:hypothetical protein [Nocardiopsis sp. CNR-923]OLT29243.1 hypothetical protein BJF83_12440 [Nocardiopsis sp. CNR-923]
MRGGQGGRIESVAYWLLYVVSVSGALLHWRLGAVLLAGACTGSAVLSAVLIARTRQQDLAPDR